MGNVKFGLERSNAVLKSGCSNVCWHGGILSGEVGRGYFSSSEMIWSQVCLTILAACSFGKFFNSEVIFSLVLEMNSLA